MARRQPYRMDYQKTPSRVTTTQLFRSPSNVYSVNRGGIPSFMDVKLCYQDTISLNTAVGSFQTYAFGANDCYDPNNTGIGHQPLHYDQYSALYQKWMVVSSNIVVRPITSTASSSYEIPAWLGVYLAPTTTAAPITESSFLEFLRLAPNTSPAQLIGGQEDQMDTYRFKRVGCNYHSLRDNVRDRIESIPESFGGTTSSSPNDLWYFIVQLFSVSGNDPAQRTLSIEITYNVRFWEPKQVTGS